MSRWIEWFIQAWKLTLFLNHMCHLSISFCTSKNNNKVIIKWNLEQAFRYSQSSLLVWMPVRSFYLAGVFTDQRQQTLNTASRAVNVIFFLMSKLLGGNLLGNLTVCEIKEWKLFKSTHTHRSLHDTLLMRTQAATRLHYSWRKWPIFIKCLRCRVYTSRIMHLFSK